MKTVLKGVCHEIVYLYFFQLFKHIWAPDKQGKVFSNSFSISTKDSVTTNEKFDSAMCMTPRSQNFKLSKTAFYTSNLFFHDRSVHP